MLSLWHPVSLTGLCPNRDCESRQLRQWRSTHPGDRWLGRGDAQTHRLMRTHARTHVHMQNSSRWLCRQFTFHIKLIDLQRTSKLISHQMFCGLKVKHWMCRLHPHLVTFWNRGQWYLSHVYLYFFSSLNDFSKYCDRILRFPCDKKDTDFMKWRKCVTFISDLSDCCHCVPMFSSLYMS